MPSGWVAAIAEPYDLDGHAISINASIGVALSPSDGLDADHLLKNADIALYRAKSDGRGTFRFFEAEMMRASRPAACWSSTSAPRSTPAR